MRTPKKIEISYQEIAKLLNITEATLRKRVSRNEFDFNNLSSIIDYVAAQTLLKKAKKQ